MDHIDLLHFLLNIILQDTTYREEICQDSSILWHDENFSSKNDYKTPEVRIIMHKPILDEYYSILHHQQYTDACTH